MAPEDTKAGGNDAPRLWGLLDSVVSQEGISKAEKWLDRMPRVIQDIEIPSNDEQPKRPAKRSLSRETLKSVHLRQHLKYLIAVLLSAGESLASNSAQWLHHKMQVELPQDGIIFPWQQSLQLTLSVRQGDCQGAVTQLVLGNLGKLASKSKQSARANVGREMRQEIQFYANLWAVFDCLLSKSRERWRVALATLDTLLHIFQSVQATNIVIQAFGLTLHPYTKVAPTRDELLSSLSLDKDLDVEAKSLCENVIRDVANVVADVSKIEPEPTVSSGAVLTTECARVLHGSMTQILTNLATQVFDYRDFLHIVPKNGDASFYLPFVRLVRNVTYLFLKNHLH